MMKALRRVGAPLVFAVLLAGCGSSGGKSNPDSGAVGDGALADSATGGDSGRDAATSTDGGGGGALPTITGFDLFTAQGAKTLVCDPAGTCYGDSSTVNKLPLNATSYTTIGSIANGVTSQLLAGMLRDSQGNLYTTSGCAGTVAVYRLLAGQTTWTTLGTGLSGSMPISCNYNTLGIDDSGTLYLGFAVAGGLFKLPAGQTAWVTTGTGITQPVRSVATRGNDVYVGNGTGVLVLTSGTTTWVAHGTGAVGNTDFLAFDGAGNLYTVNSAGFPNAGVYKLAAGTTTWVMTSNLDSGDVNNSNVTNLAFDSQNNVYMIGRASFASGSPPYALMKLPAGTLAWQKVVDLPVALGSDTCHAMANDNNGHLVVQCMTKLLRSMP